MATLSFSLSVLNPHMSPPAERDYADGRLPSRGELFPVPPWFCPAAVGRIPSRVAIFVPAAVGALCFACFPT